MKKITIWLLTAALVLGLCACGKKEADVTSTDVAEIAPVALSVLDADYVAYYSGDITTRLRRAEDKWVWADDETFPLDGACVEELLSAAADLAPLTPLEGAPALADCGLEGAETYLSVTIGEESHTLYFGNQASDGSTYMYREGAEDAVYLVNDTFMALLRRHIYDMMLLPQLPALTVENIKCVVTKNDAEETVTIVNGQEGWKSGGQLVSDEKMTPVLTALAGLKLERCFDFDPSPTAASLCGFDTPAMTLNVLYVNSVSVETSLLLSVGAEQEDSGLYYVMLEGDPSVYLMADETLDVLLALAGTAAG